MPSAMERAHAARILTPRVIVLRATAWGILATVRMALWVLPFKIVQRTLAITAPAQAPASADRPDDTPDAYRIRQVGTSIEHMSRYVPACTCLVQALSADWLLKWLRQPAHLRIGARRDADGKLLAHSWLESGGRVIVGNLPDLSAYRVLSGRTGRTGRKDTSG
jgi:hypothetical protein